MQHAWAALRCAPWQASELPPSGWHEALRKASPPINASVLPTAELNSGFTHNNRRYSRLHSSLRAAHAQTQAPQQATPSCLPMRTPLCRSRATLYYFWAAHAHKRRRTPTRLKCSVTENWLEAMVRLRRSVYQVGTTCARQAEGG